MCGPCAASVPCPACAFPRVCRVQAWQRDRSWQLARTSIDSIAYSRSGHNSGVIRCGYRPDPPPPSLTCTAGVAGRAVLFQIDRNTKEDKQNLMTSFVLYTNGSWMFEEFPNPHRVVGTLLRKTNGCLDPGKLASLDDAMSKATWQVSVQEHRCMAYAIDYTTYSFKGKPVYRYEMCDGGILDEESRKALAAANAIINPLMAA